MAILLGSLPGDIDMTRIWKGLAACVGTLVVATCATCSNSLYSQEATPSDAPSAAAEEAAEEDEGIEFDESTPDEESAQPGSPSVGGRSRPPLSPSWGTPLRVLLQTI